MIGFTNPAVLVVAAILAVVVAVVWVGLGLTGEGRIWAGETDDNAFCSMTTDARRMMV